MNDGAAAVDSSNDVFRSVSRGDCLERAFVLDAVGIGSEMRREPPWHVLSVDEADALRAREELSNYERDRSVPPPPAPPQQMLHPHAWLGCGLYAAVLIVIGVAVANGLGRVDAFQAGALDSGLVRAGQLWRAWTALTLHLDGEHLSANLLVGIWFGYLAGRTQGPGHAWFLIVTGAAASNLLEALFTAADHRAVGASTAVFTALGLLSAYTWGTRTRGARRWALRWAPFVCGAVLLAWFGSGDAAKPGKVDVAAHALGFAIGSLLGIVAARSLVQRLLKRIPQWVTGLVALAEIAVAWSFALRS